MEDKSIEKGTYISLKRSLNSHTPESTNSINTLKHSSEVFPNLFIGNRHSVKTPGYLKENGITHVVNAAATAVITYKRDFECESIKLKQVFLLDLKTSDISRYFEEVAEFIDDAIKSGGKVLVNCFQGK